jgi:hypothetical protein
MEDTTFKLIGSCNCRGQGCKLYETDEGRRFCVVYVNPKLLVWSACTQEDA